MKVDVMFFFSMELIRLIQMFIWQVLDMLKLSNPRLFVFDQ